MVWAPPLLGLHCAVLCAGPLAQEVLSGDALASPQLPASLPDPQESPAPCSVLGVPWLPVTALCPFVAPWPEPGWSRQNVESLAASSPFSLLSAGCGWPPLEGHSWTRGQMPVLFRAADADTDCALTYAVLHKGLEHLRVLVSGGWVLEPVPLRYRGTTIVMF